MIEISNESKSVIRTLKSKVQPKSTYFFNRHAKWKLGSYVYIQRKKCGAVSLIFKMAGTTFFWLCFQALACSGPGNVAGWRCPTAKGG